MATGLIPYAFRPGTDSTYRRLPVVGPLLDDWLAWLRSRGYSELSIRNLVVRAARLCRWLQRHGRVISILGRSDLRAADDHFHGRQIEVAGVAHVLGRFLAERHLLRPEAEKPPTRIELQILNLAEYLREVRGLSPQTILGHCRRVRLFLQFLRLDERPSALGRVGPVQIDAYLCRAAKTNNRFSMQQIVASLRTFLRRLHAEGLLRDPLYQQIDTPRTYRLEQLPRAWPWDQVTALLRSVDCSNPGGLRDFTLLYLAACYGLRSGELVRLTLDDAHGLAENWQLLCLATGVVDERGRPPRLHDLRHSFAVTALDRWYQLGLDVSSKLPHLATYMGHVSIASTHYYLQLSPELGQSASQRFHHYADRLFTPGGAP